MSALVSIVIAGVVTALWSQWAMPITASSPWEWFGIFMVSHTIMFVMVLAMAASIFIPVLEALKAIR